MVLNLGILVYKNKFEKYDSKNLGDYIQSIAQINFYRKLLNRYYDIELDIENFIEKIFINNFKDFKFVFIARDNLIDSANLYKDDNIYLIMSGWFLETPPEDTELQWPPPENIIPIFVSFHIANEKLFNQKYISYFKKHQPIGCRDLTTKERLKKNGVEAFFSGCLTLTLDCFDKEINKKDSSAYFVDVRITIENFKEEKFNKKNKIYSITHKMDFDKNDYYQIFSIALSTLQKYSQAKYVYTSRLHAFVPCLAFNVPVSFTSPSAETGLKSWRSKNRFAGLTELKDNPSMINGIKDKLNSLLFDKFSKIIDN